jgi:hypothetical protein
MDLVMFFRLIRIFLQEILWNKKIMDYKITSFKFNQTTRIIYFRKIKALNNKILFKNKVKIQIKLIIIPT